MSTFLSHEAPPTDFVAFLAERGGLSPEAAASRLERWFGEYHAAGSKKALGPKLGHGVQSSLISA